MKPVLISGIQPTGKLHIGNYLGSLKNFVTLQNSGKYECFFFIADLHSLTEDFNPKDKPGQVLNVALDYLSAGLSPEKSIIFQQSEVPAHSELAIILNNFTPLGELRRMTQFKDKSENQSENVNAGLFDYPVLMAADILLYDAAFVPVGDDQIQHLELARTLARRFNGRFGKTFIEPKPLLTAASRIMSLDDPTKKMSKSRPAGCLFLDDEPAVILKKIMGAVTDSGKEIKQDRENKPAISNLMDIYAGIINHTGKEIEREFSGVSYAEFKKSLAEETIKILAPFQKKKKSLMTNTGFVKKTLAAGNKKANVAASKKLTEVKKNIGLI
jgi:tryptophanyl-tRNA synthetase